MATGDNQSQVAVFEVKEYMVIWRQVERREFEGIEVKIRSMVRCMGEEYTLDVLFLTHDSDYPEEPIIELENKRGYMFLPASGLEAFVDILRNERPIYGHLRGDRPEWTSVTTTNEPVGSGDEDYI